MKLDNVNALRQGNFYVAHEKHEFVKYLCIDFFPFWSFPGFAFKTCFYNFIVFSEVCSNHLLVVIQMFRLMGSPVAQVISILTRYSYR